MILDASEPLLILFPQKFSFSYQKSESEDARKYEMNLANSEYREALEPIMTDCECVACKNHTRAYIHHLLTVKELLGPVLLMM